MYSYILWLCSTRKRNASTERQIFNIELQELDLLKQNIKEMCTKCEDSAYTVYMLYGMI